MRLCSLLVVCLLSVPTAAGAVVNINSDPYALPPPTHAVTMHRMQAFNAAGQSVGECYRDAVKGDPRFAEALRNGNLGDLIVDAAPVCTKKANAYIEAYDRLFGAGGVDHFVDKFLGPMPGVLFKYFTDTARQ